MSSRTRGTRDYYSKTFYLAKPCCYYDRPRLYTVPAQDQLVEEGSTEDINTEVPPEPEAQLAEYNVSAGNPVQDTTIHPTAPDTPSTAAPTDEPQDYQQPEPPKASGHDDEDALTEDPVSAPSTSPQLPPASSRPTRDSHMEDTV